MSIVSEKTDKLFVLVIKDGFIEINISFRYVMCYGGGTKGALLFHDAFTTK